ncbi:MAG: hypothetical protein U0176_11345 [Bacteroidia bacterium]
MKNHLPIHSHKLLAFMLFLLATTTANTLLAQSAVHRQLEGGLLENGLHFQSYHLRQPRTAGLQSIRTSLTPYFKVTGPKGRFLRVHTGPQLWNMTSDFSRQIDSTTLLSTQTANRELIWVTGITYGHEFHPFEEDFAERFSFMIGAGLQHTYQVSRYALDGSTLTDSTLGGTQFQSVELYNGGIQSLAVVGMAQVDFRITDRLHLGLEWRAQSWLSFGAYHTRRVQTTGGSGVSNITETQESRSDFRLGRGIRASSYPCIQIGWRI